jgi:hypothetical protein
MPCVELKRTTPGFERAKAVHALARAATVIGLNDTRCLALSPFFVYVIVLFPCFALTCFIIGQLKNPPHPGLEPATFRLVA